jgi:hypothetical protein
MLKTRTKGAVTGYIITQNFRKFRAVYEGEKERSGISSRWFTTDPTKARVMSLDEAQEVYDELTRRVRRDVFKIEAVR